MPELKRSVAYRRNLGDALYRSRPGMLLFHTRGSGVDHRTVERLEAGETTRSIFLHTIYLLALHYRANLADVLMGDEDIGPWPQGDTPSLTETDAYVRTAVRERRTVLGIGTPTAAQAANVHVSWWNRFENGHVGIDVVRLERMAAVLGTTIRDLLPPAFGAHEEPTHVHARKSAHA